MLLLHLLHISAAHRQHFLLSINWGQLGFLSPQCKEIDAPGKDSVNWVVIPVACHKRSQKMGGRFLLSLGIPKILYSPERWILFLNSGVQLWSADCCNLRCAQLFWAWMGGWARCLPMDTFSREEGKGGSLVTNLTVGFMGFCLYPSETWSALGRVYLREYDFASLLCAPWIIDQLLKTKLA